MFTLNCKGQLHHFSAPIVMGILNATPDSFFKESRISSKEQVLQKATQMIEEGAIILDIGGQSTRPGSHQISESEELERVLPAIEIVHQAFPEQLISIDTFYASVARAAVEAGAAIVNDISAGSIDENLLSTVGALQVPYVLMHMQGHPQTMQNAPTYSNVTLKVFDTLSCKLKELERLGIKDIIVDPGFGFGKTIEHNFQLLKELPFLAQLQKPLLMGLSRKGTIYKTLNTTADKALNGTTVLNTIALQNGAAILRVHDVKQAAEAIKLVGVYKNTKSSW